MATTPILMYGGAITSALSTLYTAPATGTTVISNINVSSATTGSLTLNLSNNGNPYPLIQQTVTANTVYDYQINQVLGQNQTITAQQTGATPAWTAVSNGTISNQAPRTIATDGNGTWVTVGSTGTNGLYSTNNGLTWAIMTMPTNAGVWTSVTYGGGYFVAIGGVTLISSTQTSNLTAYSTNGSTWTAGNNLPSTSTWVDITYGNGTFVAIAGGGTASNAVATATSATGTWTARTGASSDRWSKITYGNGYFVAVAGNSGNSTAAQYSTNGSTWTSSTLPASSTWQSVVYGNGYFIAITLAGATAISGTNGSTWTTGTSLPTGTTWSGIAYGSNLWVVVGTSLSAYSTNNGSTWTSFTGQPTTAAASPVGYGNGWFNLTNNSTTANTWYINLNSASTINLSISGVNIV